MCSSTDPKALTAEKISTPPRGGPCRDHVCFVTFAAVTLGHCSSFNTHGGRASLEFFHFCPPIFQPHSFLPLRISTFFLESDLIITKSCSSSASLFCINNNYLYPEETTSYALLNSEEMILSALLDSEEITLSAFVDPEEMIVCLLRF